MPVGFNHPEAINGRELAVYEHSEAGLVSGLATRALIQPLDVLKIRFQLQEEPFEELLKENTVDCSNLSHLSDKKKASGLFGKVIYQPKAYQLFMALCKIRRFYLWALAGCTAMTAAMPLDVIRTRLVAQGKPKIYEGAFHAVCKIWTMEKIPGFFRGIVPSLTQIAPYTGIQFSSYNFLSVLWNKYLYQHESAGALVCGALSGTFAKTVLYPLDLVRHRQQVNSLIRQGFGKTTQDKGMFRLIRGIIRRESVLGLFKGLWPSMIKAGANSGLSFLFYELACDVLRAT
uniref:Mitochondrial carrier protein n=1 Tax=Ditylenchus dipsaci TaxID=166011 RepID=A0A915DEM0_9BILA